MINGDRSYFLDKLFLLEDLEVAFRGREYLIQGYTTHIGEPDQGSHIEMFGIGPSADEGYVFQYDAPTNEECAERFLRALIWDGMAFSRAEQEIEWLA